MEKRISVLMGIYNCASTLPQAIDSILAQTYSNWELIMCDDGSFDDTHQVAERYQKKYPEKIKLLKNEENMGLNYTLNRCLEQATGEYIARQDGDDISLPNRFEEEVAALEADKTLAVVSSAVTFFDETGDWGTGGARCEYPKKEMLARGTVHVHAPSMICTRVMRRVGGYSVHKRLLRVEDWHLWLKIYAAGWRGRNLKQALYKVRDDRNAVGRRKFRYRLNEAYVAVLAVKTLGLPKSMYVFAVRPIIVGLLPKPIYLYLHRKRLKKNA